MAVRNIENYKETLWDFDVFKGCFPKTSMSFTDVDAITERNGYFLVIETKKAGVQLPVGQRIMFDAMLDTEKFTIYIVEGAPGNPTAIEIWTRQRKLAKESCNLSQLKKLVKNWFQYANRRT